MPAAVLNIELEQGATFELPFAYRVAGVAVNITAYLGRGQVRLTTAAATVLASFTLVVTDATQGTGKIRLGATALNGVTLEGPRHNNKLECSWDFELYNPSDEEDVIRLFNGVARISPNVTRVA